jgi:hypothetical protein
MDSCWLWRWARDATGRGEMREWWRQFVRLL